MKKNIVPKLKKQGYQIVVIILTMMLHLSLMVAEESPFQILTPSKPLLASLEIQQLTYKTKRYKRYWHYYAAMAKAKAMAQATAFTLLLFCMVLCSALRKGILKTKALRDTKSFLSPHTIRSMYLKSPFLLSKKVYNRKNHLLKIVFPSQEIKDIKDIPFYRTTFIVSGRIGTCIIASTFSTGIELPLGRWAINLLSQE